MSKKRIVGLLVAPLSVIGVLTVGLAPAQAAPPSTDGTGHPCVAVTTYGNGPGKGQFSKNYRAFDRYCDENYVQGGTWYGPWRLKKATADHDRDVRNDGRF